MACSAEICDHALLHKVDIPTVQGSEAYAAKVKFPKDSEVLDRTVIVGSMNPQVTLEQVRAFGSLSCKRRLHCSIHNPHPHKALHDAAKWAAVICADFILAVDLRMPRLEAV